MAQRSRSSYKSYKNSQFATNGSGNITAVVERAVHEDLADSVVFIEDGVDTDVRHFEQSDFIIGTTNSVIPGWGYDVSGTAAQAQANGTLGVDATEKALGVVDLETGTDTTGYAMLHKGSQLVLGNGHTIKIRSRIGFNTLSDGTDTYTAYFGLFDYAGGDYDPGSYFTYTHGTNSGKWQSITTQSASSTTNDTGVTATTNYSIFELEVNAANTSHVFKINGSTVATHTTNLPTGTVTFLIRITKSAGTSRRILGVDWYDLLITRSTAR